MGWRILYIEEALRLNYKLNAIGIMQKDDVTWINLDEIDCIIVESNTCNTSFRLLSEISKKGINLLICDERHLPIGILNCLHDNQRTAKYNRLQIEWDKNIKQIIWKEIVKNKITMQIATLVKLGKRDKLDLMINFLNEIQEGDISNREGLAAKVYFRELFGDDFVRERNSSNIYNSALNYSYQIIRSKISQEIVAHGYIPSIGIFHSSEYNYFGLSDDLIEAYRPIIDYHVITLIRKDEVEFMTSIFKEKLTNCLFKEVEYNKKNCKLYESIKLYVRNVLDCLTNQTADKLIFPNFSAKIEEDD